MKREQRVWKREYEVGRRGEERRGEWREMLPQISERATSNQYHPPT